MDFVAESPEIENMSKQIGVGERTVLLFIGGSDDNTSPSCSEQTIKNDQYLIIFRVFPSVNQMFVLFSPVKPGFMNPVKFPKAQNYIPSSLSLFPFNFSSVIQYILTWTEYVLHWI